MDWIVEPLSVGFMQRALVAGLLASTAAALIGTWVVVRGLTFLGDALAHGVLPGIAIAVVLGVNVLLGGLLSALVMVALVTWIGRRSRLGDDAAIGLLFVGMLALGVVVISSQGSYQGDLTAILFGDPLGATRGDVFATGAAAVATTAIIVAFHRSFLALAFSHDKAQLLGLHPDRTHALLLVLVAVVVVASFRTVGTLLVFALLVAPPSTAALVARRVPVLMGVATGLGALAVLSGLLVSWHAGTATAATIALVAVVQFFVVLVGRDLLVSRRSRTRRAVRSGGSPP